MLTASCSVYRHIPQGENLLADVDVTVQGDQVMGPSYYKSLSYQQPNSKWFGIFKVPLRAYYLKSNKESAGRRSIFKNMGEAPVLCDTLLCDATRQDILRSLANSGYMKPYVDYTISKGRRPKAKVQYVVRPGQPYRVDKVSSIVPDPVVRSLLESSGGSLISPGMILDASVLDQERSRITLLMQQNGYYRFNKECISFVADTVAGSYDVGLTMRVEPYAVNDSGVVQSYPRYTIDRVGYVLADNANFSTNSLAGYDRTENDAFEFFSKGTPKLKYNTIESHSYLRNGMVYNPDSVSMTYSSLSRLGLLRYTNIQLDDVPGTTGLLDAKAYLVMRPKYSVSFDVEGTNTAGDLGAAAFLSLVNRNLFGGAEQLTLKTRIAYEAITDLPGYSGDNSYKEYGIEANLDFPEFLVPFLSQDIQRKSQATSQFSAKFNSQQRPEFNKRVFSTSWSYLWGTGVRTNHRFDVTELNYLVVPWISDNFRREYLDAINSKSSILKYNYEDMLISKIGYTFYSSNSMLSSAKRLQYSIRLNIETSGNVFYGFSELFGADVNSYGQYKVLGIAFAQYVKHDLSFTTKYNLNTRNNVLFHFEYGIGVPYANSTTLPFEKRYFAGGANSVRGWAVRELGPGSYTGGDNYIDYIKQSGDIKLFSSLEYRSRLFWKVNGALFLDAGNIWTIREYEEQPGGCFAFDSFYKQIAVAYGLGVRLDLGFLVLRFDGGMKAVNPAYTSHDDHYPVLNPNLKRDFTFHLAVGYPF